MEFTFDDSLAQYNVPVKTWLSSSPTRPPLDAMATSTLIFNNDKVLLVQRASTDSMPDQWEAPGGAVDAQDQSILHGAAREMREETGLVAKHFVCRVTLGPGRDEMDVFYNSTATLRICRLGLLVEAESCDAVELDAREHQAHVWASEQQVVEQAMGTMTTPSMQALVVEAFCLRRQAKARLANDEATGNRALG
ncbi:hypothetical protein CDD82_5106 [Ophiocordyceps australis]|uniref:Nudix hydrolase domain-containing protein n=1 Tax=Ophiocordyceps australis TaxID=1399860 RepID=A0A2C5Z272_9HYPO|nr:hypothetical protein CDD82_5106 [Ophiocordyceps australis]